MNTSKPDERALRRYGQEVRRLRQEGEMTLDALGRHVGSSRTQLSDVERGLARPSSRLRHALDEAIGHGRLNRLWDDLTGDGKEAWRYEVAELVDSATAIYEYQIMVFPFQLQTEDYARVLVRYGAPWLSSEDIETETALRAARAERVANGSGGRMWLVVDESILSRRYGSTSIMREQLGYVVDLAERERLTIQMVKAGEPRHPGNSGPFKLITSPYAPEALYTESTREGQLSTNDEHIKRYRMLFAALQGVAASPDETLEALRKEIKRFDHE